MVIDCHVHVSAATEGHGSMSPVLRRTLPFRFMRWRFGIPGYDEAAERAVEAKLDATLEETTQLGAAVILAFDAVYDADGRRNDADTHLYVTNDYVIELAARHPKMLFGASVHPYRPDAVAELERCVAAGAVLCKWLPISHRINPADERCFPFYEALAHHGLPLLSHTGGEKTLPVLDASVADPTLLEPALKRGVTVIAAHCGTRAGFRERDYLADFARMAEEYERCYGDTAALNLPARAHAWDVLLKRPAVRAKLVHGSDWPIIALPMPGCVGWGASLSLLRDGNWMRRDVKIKERLGLDGAYWHRAAQVLRMPRAVPAAAFSPLS